MKIEWSTVFEFMLGATFAGIVLILIHGLVGGWVAKQGAELTGSLTTGADAK